MFVSVIIPAYNAQKTIKDCLSALSSQIFSGDEYEIIVVDDGSTDNTPEIIKKEFPKVRLISRKNAGPAVARNHGAKEAKGEIILFTDSDCCPRENWLEEMLKPFKANPEIIGVKGVYMTKQREITARFVQLEYEDKYDLMAKDEYIDFIDTYSAGFKREVFLSMNGYDENFPVACSEDAEFSFRLSNKGYKMIFIPGAIVSHIHPDRFIAYAKKKFKFAYWRMLAVKKNPNKLIKDSHTPQIMKFQLLLSPVIVFFALGAPFCEYCLMLFTGLFGFYLILSLPFVFKAIKKDFMVGIISPLFLFSRSLAQFAGVLLGFKDTFILKKWK